MERRIYSADSIQVIRFPPWHLDGDGRYIREWHVSIAEPVPIETIETLSNQLSGPLVWITTAANHSGLSITVSIISSIRAESSECMGMVRRWLYEVDTKVVKILALEALPREQCDSFFDRPV